MNLTDVEKQGVEFSAKLAEWYENHDAETIAEEGMTHELYSQRKGSFVGSPPEETNWMVGADGVTAFGRVLSGNQQADPSATYYNRANVAETISGSELVNWRELV